MGYFAKCGDVLHGCCINFELGQTFRATCRINSPVLFNVNQVQFS